MTTKTLEFRITSTYPRNKLQFIYGMPVVSGTTRKKSGKDVVKVQALRELLPFEPANGQQWIVSGEYEEVQSVRYQRLYNDIHFKSPESLEITLPEGDQGFKIFISNEIHGVSTEKAENIWEAFGKNIYFVLDEEDKEKLLAVEGIGQVAANNLIKGYKKYANLKHCNWLAKHKVPLYVQQRLIKYHNEKSIEVIKANLYELVTFGMKFDDVDQLARNYFDVLLDSDTRLAASVKQAMTILCRGKRPGTGGHTYIDDKKKLSQEIASFIGKDFVDKAFEAGKKDSSFITFKQFNDTYFHHDLLIVETTVARHIAKLAIEPINDWGSEHIKAYEVALDELPYDLTQKQRDAVKTSLFNNISLITGGAGTGKTTVTRTVLRAYNEMGYQITAVALSGRAAMRLHESVRFKTSTIAKFLREDELIDEEPNQVKHILVIDESSMIDIVTLYRIINHITSNTRLLFVGDQHQLPPIGAGLVLSQLDEVPLIKKTHLDIVKRQEASTGIPEYSLSIRKGKMPKELTTGAIEFHDSDSYETVVDLYCRDDENSIAIAATKTSVDKLNLIIQERLNSESPKLQYEDEFGQWYFASGSDSSAFHCLLHHRLNDPVVFIRNNYEVGYQNGSLGILTNIDQNKTEGTLGTVRLIDTGEEINITETILNDLRTAYSITLHKAQGSQFKNCLVYLDKTTMIDRSWIYTAVTRSEENLHIIGTKDRFIKAVKSESAIDKRNAHLAWLINSYIEQMTDKKDAA